MTKINLTSQRKAILEVIQTRHDHPTAADIIEGLRERGFNFAYGTIYNSLRYLTDTGLIRELKLGEAVSRYDGRTEDHHHIVCSSCGRVDEVLCEPPAAWLKAVSAETSYQVREAQVVFEGVCEPCSKTKQ
ncbi:Fur family transcriptional regulator [Paenibacillus swuensis]|uniref:Fur family transcriptional regulator n=1 Tax=Paenibacillus swuensis TaxID=1178515 RepID=A0A172THP5_9BACL|nr:transcriptional repressor [Paenibacillus swuensis]ANE46578.1 Fur family transcriptional regulator [Paenibacillus swuensis]